MANNTLAAKHSQRCVYLLISSFIFLALILSISELASASISEDLFDAMNKKTRSAFEKSSLSDSSEEVHIIYPSNGTALNQAPMAICGVNNTRTNELTLRVWNSTGTELTNRELWNITANDNGDGEDYTFGIAKDASDNIYLVGETEFATDEGTNPDVWTLKYDKNGNLLWNKTFGGDGMDLGIGIATDNSNNVYVVGRTDSFGAGGTDLFVLKYSSTGNLLWNKTFGGTGEDYGNGITTDSSGNLYVRGTTRPDGELLHNLWILKIDSSGNEIWNKTYMDVQKADFRIDVILDTNGNIYTTGESEAADSENTSLVLLKTDSSGNTIWNKTFGETGNSIGVALAIVSSEIYVLGATNSEGDALLSLLLAKYRLDGEYRDSKILGGTGSNLGLGLAKDSLNNLYIAGGTRVYSNGNMDAFLLKVDSYGSLIWKKSRGHNDLSTGVIVDSSDNIYASGMAVSSEQSEIWMSKYDSHSVTSRGSILIVSDAPQSYGWRLDLPREGEYLWTCTGYDFEWQDLPASEGIYSVILDETPPSFQNSSFNISDPQEIIILDNETFSYQFNATDSGSGIGCFSLDNETSAYFTINCSGFMTNKTRLPIGWYLSIIEVNDSAGNTASVYWYAHVINHTTMDLTAPIYSNLISRPDSPATYAPGKQYFFNATWTDNLRVKNIIFAIEKISSDYETAFVLNKTENNIYNKVLSDLSAGTYRYQWLGTDEDYNINFTDIILYTIDKATPALSISASPQGTLTYLTITTVQGAGCPSQLTCTLSLNGGAVVGNSETTILPVGTHTYTYSTSGNENYTAASTSISIVVNSASSGSIVSTSSASPSDSSPSSSSRSRKSSSSSKKASSVDFLPASSAIPSPVESVTIDSDEIQLLNSQKRFSKTSDNNSILIILVSASLLLVFFVVLIFSLSRPQNPVKYSPRQNQFPSAEIKY